MLSHNLAAASTFLLLTLFLASPTESSTASSVPALHVNHRSFADALTSVLYENENECTSALGVSIAFSLIYPSATGNSMTQIRNVLGFPGGSHLQLVWNATSTRLDESYNGTCLDLSGGECLSEVPTLEIANSVWIDDNDALDAAYFDVVGDYLRQIDFQDSETDEVINEWVNASTHGLIDCILDEPPSDFILLALNSIYLKANWPKPFVELYTNQDVFHTSVDGTSSTAHFMHTVDSFFYSHNALPGFQILQMDFNAGDLSLLLVLPAIGDNSYASSGDVLAAVPQLEETYVALALPKFKFESKYQGSLMGALQSVGVVAPFLGGLCVFENDCSAFISLVIQKTFISLDEKGVEAAAVTLISVDRDDYIPLEDPILFQADHRFQFFIYDKTEQLVIFEGHVGNPGVPQGAAAPQLQANHTDPNFWSSHFGVSPVMHDLSQPIPSSSPIVTRAKPGSHLLSVVHEKSSESSSGTNGGWDMPLVLVVVCAFVLSIIA